MFDLLYWHWIVAGLALVALEIFIPSFTALWFGCGAVIVGVLLLIFPDLPLAVQLVLWTLLSSTLTWGWFKYLKPLAVDKTKAGLSRESIVGQVGQVVHVPVEGHKGKLRFPAPILGDDEWEIITEDTVALGDRVRVTDVSGNSLIVTKHNG